MTVKITKRN